MSRPAFTSLQHGIMPSLTLPPGPQLLAMHVEVLIGSLDLDIAAESAIVRLPAANE